MRQHPGSVCRPNRHEQDGSALLRWQVPRPIVPGPMWRVREG